MQGTAPQHAAAAAAARPGHRAAGQLPAGLLARYRGYIEQEAQSLKAAGAPTAQWLRPRPSRPLPIQEVWGGVESPRKVQRSAAEEKARRNQSNKEILKQRQQLSSFHKLITGLPENNKVPPLHGAQGGKPPEHPQEPAHPGGQREVRSQGNLTAAAAATATAQSKASAATTAASTQRPGAGTSPGGATNKAPSNANPPASAAV